IKMRGCHSQPKRSAPLFVIANEVKQSLFLDCFVPFDFAQGILRRRAPQNDRLPKPMWQTTAGFDAQCASNGNKKEEFILNTFCGNFLGQYLMLLYLARSVSQMAIYSVHQI